MKRAIFLLAAALLCPALAGAAGGTVVGNGGGGIIDHGKLYVLDLFEAGTAKTPHFEGASQHELVFSQWDTEVDYDHRLLARKIDELNDRFSGLGDMIVTALKFFRLTFAERSLALTCDGPCLPGQVQLAIRRYRTVYLDRELWKKLDDAQKIALLIHEGVYSYAKIHCNRAKVCRQVSRSVRPIVGLLFAPDRSKDSEISTWIRERLRIDGLYPGRLDESMHFTVEHWPREDKAFMKFKWPTDSAIAQKEIYEFCLKGKNQEEDLISLALDGSRVVSSVFVDPYDATYGLQWGFYGLVHEKRSTQILMAVDCETVSRQAVDWPKTWRVWH